MRIGPKIVVKTHLAYKGNTANDKNTDNFTQKSDLFKIYANWAQHFVKTHLAYKGNTANDKNTDNFTQKSDLFKIYANWAQHCC